MKRRGNDDLWELAAAALIGGNLIAWFWAGLQLGLGATA